MDRVFQENIQALAIRQNPPVLNIIYLCDCSGSMAGSRIAAVNTALTKVLAELMDVSIVYPQIKFQMGILSFANTAIWHLPPTPLAKINWSPLVDTGGITALGAAYRLLANYLVKAEEQTPRSATQPLAPILILFSDGMPTDDFTTALANLSAAPLANQSLRFAIGIGQEVDTTVLQEWVQPWKLSGQPDYFRLKSIYISKAESVIELREVVSIFTLEAVRTLLTDFKP